MSAGGLRRHGPMIALLAAALAVRLALTPLYAYLSIQPGFADEYLWKLWMTQIHEHGVLNVFRQDVFVNYVGYQWVLWLLVVIYDHTVAGPYTNTTASLHVLVKMPSIAFDFALFAAVYAATRGLAAEEGRGDARAGQLAFAATAVIAFQPAVLYDGAIWSQTDSAVTCVMVSSIYLASRGSASAAWAVLALGLLIKPHPTIVLPVVAIMTLHTSGGRGLARGVGIGAAIVVAALLPWLVHGDGERVLQIYRHLYRGDYAELPPLRLSASAWNVWWFVDLAHHHRPSDAMFGALPGLTYERAGIVLSFAAGALALAYLLERPRLRDALIASAYVVFAFYMLPTSTHERYLYPVLALLLPVTLLDRRWLWLYVPASLILPFNLFIAAPPVLSWAGRWYESSFTLAFASVNVVLFASFTGWMLRETLVRVGAPPHAGPSHPRNAR